VIAGFGYWARFHSLNKVPPLIFSGLSYTGLITGYVFAVLFGIDALTKIDIVSIVGVLLSILGLTFTPYGMGSESLLI
jgi:predicted exporter